MPSTLDKGGGDVTIGNWLDNPRTMVFTKAGENDVTLTWEVSTDDGLTWELSGVAPVPTSTPTEPAPTDVTVGTVAATSILLSWSGNDEAENYLVQFRHSGQDWDDAKQYQTSETSLSDASVFDDNQLVESTAYTIRVGAVYDNGDTTSWSDSASATTAKADAGLVGPPNFTVDYVGGTFALLDWDPPRINGNPYWDYHEVNRGTPYTIQFRTIGQEWDEGLEWVTSYHFLYDLGDFEDQPLSTGTTYQVRVGVEWPEGFYFPAGMGWSAIKTITTQASDPIGNAPGSVQLTETGSDYVKITWTEPSGFIWIDRRYRIQFRESGQTWDEALEYQTSWYEFDDTVLQPSTSYSIRVGAKWPGGTRWAGTFSATTNAAAPPDKITIMNSPIKNGQLYLNWIPRADNGAAIEAWQVELGDVDADGVFNPGPSFCLTPAHNGFSGRTHDADGKIDWARARMDHGSHYQARVRGYNAAGWGEWSDIRWAYHASVSWTTDELTASCGVIDSLELGTVSGSYILLDGWTGGIGAEHYLVQFRTDGQEWSEAVQLQTSESSLTDSTLFAADPLSPETEYEIRVGAVYDDGETTEWSDSVTATTRPLHDLPNQVSNLEVHLNGSFIEVSFAVPYDGGKSAIDMFELQVDDYGNQFGLDSSDYDYCITAANNSSFSASEGETVTARIAIPSGFGDSHVKVRAHNGNGWIDYRAKYYSEFQRSATLPHDADLVSGPCLEDRPDRLLYASREADSFELTWQPAAGLPEGREYEVQIRLRDATTWDDALVYRTTATRLEPADFASNPLSPNTRYEMRVGADWEDGMRWAEKTARWTTRALYEGADRIDFMHDWASDGTWIDNDIIRAGDELVARFEVPYDGGQSTIDMYEVQLGRTFSNFNAEHHFCITAENNTTFSAEQHAIVSFKLNVPEGFDGTIIRVQAHTTDYGWAQNWSRYSDTHPITQADALPYDADLTSAAGCNSNAYAIYLQTGEIDHTSIELGWVAPTLPANEIAHYLVQFRTDGQEWTDGKEYQTSTASLSAADFASNPLTQDTAYEIRVGTVYDDGTTAWSGLISARSRHDRPDPVAHGGLVLSSDDWSSGVASFTVPYDGGTSIDMFEVELDTEQLGPDSDSTTYSFCVTAENNSSFSATAGDVVRVKINLADGYAGTHTRVRAHNANGWGEYSSSTRDNAYGTPGEADLSSGPCLAAAPTNVRIVVRDADFVSLLWQPAEELAEGRGYEVQIRTPGQDWSEALSYNSADTALSGADFASNLLSADTAYELRVGADHAAGMQWSETQSFSTRALIDSIERMRFNWLRDGWQYFVGMTEVFHDGETLIGSFRVPYDGGSAIDRFEFILDTDKSDDRPYPYNFSADARFCITAENNTTFSAEQGQTVRFKVDLPDGFNGWYAKVRAHNSDGWSGASSAWMFDSLSDDWTPDEFPYDADLASDGACPTEDDEEEEEE